MTTNLRLRVSANAAQGSGQAARNTGTIRLDGLNPPEEAPTTPNDD